MSSQEKTRRSRYFVLFHRKFVVAVYDTRRNFHIFLI